MNEIQTAEQRAVCAPDGQSEGEDPYEFHLDDIIFTLRNRIRS